MSFSILELHSGFVNSIPEQAGIYYIGKADNLKKRLEEYINFGYGVETHHFHSGGRAICK